MKLIVPLLLPQLLHMQLIHRMIAMIPIIAMIRIKKAMDMIASMIIMSAIAGPFAIN